MATFRSAGRPPTILPGGSIRWSGHTEIEINRPAEAVYGFFLDLERNIVATDPTVESVVKVTEGPIGPGTSIDSGSQ